MLLSKTVCQRAIFIVVFLFISVLGIKTLAFGATPGVVRIRDSGQFRKIVNFPLLIEAKVGVRAIDRDTLEFTLKGGTETLKLSSGKFEYKESPFILNPDFDPLAKSVVMDPFPTELRKRLDILFDNTLTGRAYGIFAKDNSSIWLAPNSVFGSMATSSYGIGRYDKATQDLKWWPITQIIGTAPLVRSVYFGRGTLFGGVPYLEYDGSIYRLNTQIDRWEKYDIGLPKDTYGIDMAGVGGKLLTRATVGYERYDFIVSDPAQPSKRFSLLDRAESFGMSTTSLSYYLSEVTYDATNSRAYFAGLPMRVGEGRTVQSGFGVYDVPTDKLTLYPYSKVFKNYPCNSVGNLVMSGKDMITMSRDGLCHIREHGGAPKVLFDTWFPKDYGFYGSNMKIVDGKLIIGYSSMYMTGRKTNPFTLNNSTTTVFRLSDDAKIAEVGVKDSRPEAFFGAGTNEFYLTAFRGEKFICLALNQKMFIYSIYPETGYNGCPSGKIFPSGASTPGYSAVSSKDGMYSIFAGGYLPKGPSQYMLVRNGATTTFEFPDFQSAAKSLTRQQLAQYGWESNLSFDSDDHSIVWFPAPGQLYRVNLDTLTATRYPYAKAGVYKVFSSGTFVAIYRRGGVDVMSIAK